MIGLIAQGTANTTGLVGLAITGLTIVFLWRVVEGGHKASSGGAFFKGLVPVLIAVGTLGAFRAGTLFPSLESTGASLWSYMATVLQQSFSG